MKFRNYIFNLYKRDGKLNLQPNLEKKTQVKQLTSTIATYIFTEVLWNQYSRRNQLLKLHNNDDESFSNLILNYWNVSKFLFRYNSRKHYDINVRHYNFWYELLKKNSTRSLEGVNTPTKKHAGISIWIFYVASMQRPKGEKKINKLNSAMILQRSCVECQKDWWVLEVCSVNNPPSTSYKKSPQKPVE